MVTMWKISSLNIWTHLVLAKLFPEDKAAIGWADFLAALGREGSRMHAEELGGCWNQKFRG